MKIIKNTSSYLNSLPGQPLSFFFLFDSRNVFGCSGFDFNFQEVIPTDTKENYLWTAVEGHTTSQGHEASDVGATRRESTKDTVSESGVGTGNDCSWFYSLNLLIPRIISISAALVVLSRRSCTLLYESSHKDAQFLL